MNLRVLQLSVAKLIAPFGPGAVIDVLGESFMTMTADRWPKRTLLPKIECERLSSRLGVQQFYGPPLVDDPEHNNALGINVTRFPAWLFCQSCRRMVHWTQKDETGQPPTCHVDSGRLVPMRFVVACRAHSHGSDVPWDAWLHRGPSASNNCQQKGTLRFRPAPGGSAGLSGLEISCDTCNSRRTLGDLRADTLTQAGLICHGIQPWEYEWKSCDSPLEVLQRGATSFHFAESVAAIDIPDVTATVLDLGDKIHAHTLFPGLKASLDGPNADHLAAMIATEVGSSRDSVLAYARQEDSRAEGIVPIKGLILSEEFEAFRAAGNDAADERDFKTRAYGFSLSADDPIERELAKLVDSVVLVDRLREVRASLGFRRYSLDSDVVPSVPKSNEASWLPAYEGFGEGIFLRFRPPTLDSWAARPEIIARAQTLKDRHADSRFSTRLHEPSPQSLALHGFSHALLKELSFYSGYSAASLRERVYCESNGDYGIFVYTTSTDQEGTLGGLVREGEYDRLGSTLARAAEQLSWCSNDPVCSESHPQNLDGLNLAACHSCLFASETSCDSLNLLLDRVLLVGDPADPTPINGLLRPLIDSIDKVSE